MSLNIKNEQTHRLVRQLAEVTGESQTSAVTIAVRERLERVLRSQRGDLAARLLAIGEDVAVRLPDHLKSADHGDLLYDDRGMPA